MGGGEGGRSGGGGDQGGWGGGAADEGGLLTGFWAALTSVLQQLTRHTVGGAQALVREGGEHSSEHPVHLGAEAFVLAELKVTPPLEKKVPAKRGRKRRGEEEERREAAAAAAAAGMLTGEALVIGHGALPHGSSLRLLPQFPSSLPLPSADDPVRWVRLDPGCELLCDIRLMQPERCLAAQLQHSRDVTAQAEAVQVR